MPKSTPEQKATIKNFVERCGWENISNGQIVKLAHQVGLSVSQTRSYINSIHQPRTKMAKGLKHYYKTSFSSERFVLLEDYTADKVRSYILSKPGNIFFSNGKTSQWKPKTPVTKQSLSEATVDDFKIACSNKKGSLKDNKLLANLDHHLRCHGYMLHPTISKEELTKLVLGSMHVAVCISDSKGVEKDITTIIKEFDQAYTSTPTHTTGELFIEYIDSIPLACSFIVPIKKVKVEESDEESEDSESEEADDEQEMKE